MASVHPTKHGTFEVKWRENGHPKSKTLKKLKGEGGAEQYAQAVERRLQEGKPIVRRKDAPTLREFAIQWLRDRSPDLAPGTERKYAEWLNVHILPHLGHLSVTAHDLKPGSLACWQDDRLAEGAGPAVLGKAQTLLGQILKRAVLPYEYLDSNPAAELPRPAYQRRPHRWLTAAEVEALRAWYLERDDIGSAALISVLAYVGIRPQDALARKPSELSDGGLAVTSKNSNGVIVPGSKTGESYKRRVKVPAPVRADLEEWMADDGLIWPRACDGKPWTKNDWDNWRSRDWVKRKRTGKMVRPKCFKAAAEACGLGETLKPYDLRHTAASLMAAAGWTAVEIAHQLGHSVDMSQRTYQHLLTRPHPNATMESYIEEARGVLNPFGVEAK